MYIAFRQDSYDQVFGTVIEVGSNRRKRISLPESRARQDQTTICHFIVAFSPLLWGLSHEYLRDNINANLRGIEGPPDRNSSSCTVMSCRTYRKCCRVVRRLGTIFSGRHRFFQTTGFTLDLTENFVRAEIMASERCRCSLLFSMSYREKKYPSMPMYISRQVCTV